MASNMISIFHFRNDLELQFKCYHHDDKQQLCNWPQGVSVSISGHQLQIDRVSLLNQYLEQYLGLA